MTTGGPTADELAPFLDLAERMADAAAPVVMKHFRSAMAVDSKADLSPVTLADKEAEDVMRQMILSAWPDHGIIGEERGKINAEAEFVWVLDPIDGTQSFATGKPLFGILIALLYKGRPVIGVMDHPALKERWSGCDGRPTTLNGAAAHVRPGAALDQAWLYATSPQMFPEDDFAAFERLRKKSRRAIYGAECYAYGLLASGHIDLVCESTMQPYDYCALIPVVTGAGGMITDWRGEALTLKSDGRVLASGDARIHEQAIKTLTT
ncbi:MAG: histidinol-phosphatase [Rhodospirillales bacterium]|nr:histidinol-phosphatase [Rhodospirillales bacterium]